MRFHKLLPLHAIGTALAFSANSEPLSRSRIPLKGIDASQFRHPLDRDLTSFVRGVPLSHLADDAIKASLSIVEQGARLDLLSSSVKVSPQQMPELYKSMEDASRLFDMKFFPSSMSNPTLRRMLLH